MSGKITESGTTIIQNLKTTSLLSHNSSKVYLKVTHPGTSIHSKSMHGYPYKSMDIHESMDNWRLISIKHEYPSMNIYVPRTSIVGCPCTNITAWISMWISTLVWIIEDWYPKIMDTHTDDRTFLEIHVWMWYGFSDQGTLNDIGQCFRVKYFYEDWDRELTSKRSTFSRRPFRPRKGRLVFLLIRQITKASGLTEECVVSLFHLFFFVGVEDARRSARIE